MENLNQTAWITSCKLLLDSEGGLSGWLVNDDMSVPNDPANRHCADVLVWIAEGNTPAPAFTDAEIAANTQEAINTESLAYLDSTDWYVIRQTESGVAVPVDITTARTAARLAVVSESSNDIGAT